MTKVGQFTYDPATGAVSGPAEYMKSTHFAEWKVRFAAGNDPVFRVGMGLAPVPGAYFTPDGPQSPSPEVAMLVSVQTDYAAWHGLQTLGLGAS